MHKTINAPVSVIMKAIEEIDRIEYDPDDPETKLVSTEAYD
jgi:hypothetical protein